MLALVSTGESQTNTNTRPPPTFYLFAHQIALSQKAEHTKYETKEESLVWPTGHRIPL